MLIDGVNFTELAISLRAPTGAGRAVSLRNGAFLQTIADFMIVAFAIFLVVKGMDAPKRRRETTPAAPPAPPQVVTPLLEIGDVLKQEQQHGMRLGARRVGGHRARSAGRSRPQRPPRARGIQQIQKGTRQA